MSDVDDGGDVRAEVATRAVFDDFLDCSDPLMCETSKKEGVMDDDMSKQGLGRRR